MGAALAGCAGRAVASAPPIELVTAYVGAPHHGSPTDAYVAIRNNGNATRLVAVRTSVGGTVTLRGPAGASPGTERDFSSIPIPGHALVRLNPTSYHLVITGARPMKAGGEITLTLVFAHYGSFRIPAEVTNPQTGGSSYFLNSPEPRGRGPGRLAVPVMSFHTRGRGWSLDGAGWPTAPGRTESAGPRHRRSGLSSSISRYIVWASSRRRGTWRF